MQEEIKRCKCDECGKVEELAGIRIGGTPFAGWLHLTLMERGMCPIWGVNSGPWDFCGTECLVKFLAKSRKERRKQELKNQKMVTSLNSSIRKLHKKWRRE